jgi:hypothetical protein
MHPLDHAKSSAKKYGGNYEDYLKIHEWFDASKELMGDLRHRAWRHHTAGIFECERVFGKFITNSQGKRVPVRVIGEQHVVEDLGIVPTLEAWLSNMRITGWMLRNPSKFDVNHDPIPPIGPQEIRDHIDKHPHTLELKQKPIPDTE